MKQLAILKPEHTNKLDEALFYLASGGALAVSVFTAAASAGLPETGLIGAEITLAGSLVSWWMRTWKAHRAALFGVLLGLLAGAFWAQLVEESLPKVDHDPGLSLALYMTVPMVVVAFVLLRAEIAAFSLVPGLSVMGLAAGQGEEEAARIGFTIFLPLALLAVGYSMLSTGAIAGVIHRLPDAPHQARGALHWRVRHWPTLAGIIIVIMAVAELLFFPLQRWAEAHRWQFINAMANPGITRPVTSDDPGLQLSNYKIGQGPIRLSENPVLSFTGEYAAYWRGEVYDKYLGNSWGRSDLSTMKAEFASFPLDGELSVEPAQPGEPVETHHVTVHVDLPFVFYAPGLIHQIKTYPTLSIDETAHVQVSGYDVVRLPGKTLYAGGIYDVVSTPLEMNTRPVKPEVDARYLVVPFESRRVSDLAKRIVGDATAPGRKLEAIIGYLQQNCFYNLDAPAIPQGQDAVDYFLFRQKEGYCDLFASSLAIMGRAVGVPTRLVTGYAFPNPSDRDPNTFILPESGGHAWVEAYLPENGGWVTFDATPAAREATQTRGWFGNTMLRLRILWNLRPQVLAGYTALLLLLFALAFFGGRYLLRRRRGDYSPATTDWRLEVIRIYLRLCNVLRRHGLPRHAAQTPLEYLHYVEVQWGKYTRAPDILPHLRNLTNIFLAARYSPVEVDEPMARTAHETLQSFRLALKPRK